METFKYLPVQLLVTVISVTTFAQAKSAGNGTITTDKKTYSVGTELIAEFKSLKTEHFGMYIYRVNETNFKNGETFGIRYLVNGLTGFSNDGSRKNGKLGFWLNAPGEYIVAIPTDWTFSEMIRSAPFTVRDNKSQPPENNSIKAPGPGKKIVLVPIKDSFKINEPIVIKYSGFDARQGNKILLAKPGDDDSKYIKEFPLQNKTTGRIIFETALSPGEYEVRAYTASDKSVKFRTRFRVSEIIQLTGMAMLIPRKNLFKASETILVDYSGFPENNGNSILLINDAGIIIDSYEANRSGIGVARLATTGYLTPGRYRVSSEMKHLDWLIESPYFYVGDSSGVFTQVAANKKSYVAGEKIEIRYTFIRENDRIHAYTFLMGSRPFKTEGNNKDTYSLKMNEGENLRAEFKNNLQPGEYEIRVVQNNISQPSGFKFRVEAAKPGLQVKGNSKTVSY